MENALPVKFWGLDPLYWSHLKLFARDVFRLKTYPGFKEVYAISNHPIAQVLVTGYVVKVDKKEKLTTYGVDDGTACLNCCMWHDQDNLVEAKLGDLVTVRGRIKTFREERQLTISTLHIEPNPNAEVLHWMEVMKQREIYEKPFRVPDSENPKEKIATKPWLTSERDIEIDKVQEALKKAIADYLESREMLCFTPDNLCSVGKVMEVAGQLAALYEGETDKNKDLIKRARISSTQTWQCLKDSLARLEKDGIVYCTRVASFGNPGTRQYDFISVKEDLSPRIVKVIRDICNGQGESSGGIPRSKIMANLKSLEKYKAVKRDRVESALEHLMSKGDIYETREEHYRIV